jgi:hypothetical protein
MFRTLWNWNKTQENIRSLRGRLGFDDKPYLEFLKLRLYLDSGKVLDLLRNVYLENLEPMIYYLLYMYSKSKEYNETNKLISFKKLYGGSQYYSAFYSRAIGKLNRFFKDKIGLLEKSSYLLGASRLEYGDLSFKLYALPRIPLIFIFWEGSEDISSSSNILFDESASKYYTGEEASVLADLAVLRLIHASSLVNSD